MKKGLKLLFTTLVMFTMGLTSCGSKTTESKGPEWTIREDGHLYHFDEDLGNVTGDKGDKGDKGDAGEKGDKGDTGAQGPKGDTGAQGETGPQGPAGQDGQNGANGQDGAPGVNGQDGKDGADGAPGADGKDGVGIKDISRTDNDGVMDIYTITMTDDSTYTFKVPNAPTSMTVVNNRVGEDENGDPVDLPYYVGTSAPLDITVTATFADGSEMEVNKYTVTGFDTATTGKKDVVVKFGALSDAFSVDVINIGDEIADVEGLTDILPGLSVGAVDYQYAPSVHALLVDVGEDADVTEAIAQYQADLVAASFTDNGIDSYGDKHFLSPTGEFDVCAWNYYGYIRVDLQIFEPFPLDTVNAFLTTYGLGFQLTDADATAFGRRAYQIEADTSSGYHYLLVAVMYVDCSAEWKAILEPTLEAAGFEWDDTYGFVNYSNYKQVSVAYNSDYDYTYIMFWE